MYFVVQYDKWLGPSWLKYKTVQFVVLDLTGLFYMHSYVLDLTGLSLGMLVPNSRDWHKKMATEFSALQNTP